MAKNYNFPMTAILDFLRFSAKVVRNSHFLKFFLQIWCQYASINQTKV